MSEKTSIYIFVDDRDRILAYQDSREIPEDMTGWVFIPADENDKYNLDQSHYFEDGLYTVDGIPLYKWKDLMVLSRTADEIAADWMKLQSTVKEKEGTS